MEYLYGVGNFTRVDDALDTTWSGTSGALRLNAVYTADNNSLYTAAISGTPVSTAILSEAPNQSGAPSRGSTLTAFTPVAQPFLFMLHPTGGADWYSAPTLNTSDGGKDHMVTFAVDGYLATPGVASSFTSFTDGTHYVLGFEDGVDFDYQDLVVEVDGVAPTALIPNDQGVPDGGSTLAMLGAALGVMGALGRKFRK
jgi:hypothetical protein